MDTGPVGDWCAGTIAAGGLVAPHLLPVEVAHALRRAARLGLIGAEHATLAHGDLVRLRIDLVPYGPLAERVWGLRDTVRNYDAWYVAVAEALDRPLATLDERLLGATGPRCRFITPA